MTTLDHKRLLICRKVTAELAKKYAGKYRAITLRRNLAIIDTRLLEPIEDQPNTGEYFKTDNPFV